jgi:hypothetical protein
VIHLQVFPLPRKRAQDWKCSRLASRERVKDWIPAFARMTSALRETSAVIPAPTVIPAKAGIHACGLRIREDDELRFARLAQEGAALSWQGRAGQ